jgi:hypothetical protein
MDALKRLRLDAPGLNDDCTCITLDRRKLAEDFDKRVGAPGFGDRLLNSHPTLFSHQPLFLATAHRSAIERAIAAIEAVIATPAYQSTVLAQAAATCQHRDRMNGAFMGYDFHIGADGPKLIEINTNAGGALINAALYRAHAACCTAAMPFLSLVRPPETFRDAFLETFKREWEAFGANRRLTRVAIVDMAPESQFLYPEFVLFKRMLEDAGIETIIAAPDMLYRKAGGLWVADKAIDLVYNRLTDFQLQAPESFALRDAYLADEAAVTPNPRLHALYADKRNLVLLGDARSLKSLGVSEMLAKDVLAVVPHSAVVDTSNREDLWRRRDQFFFKPASGFGSKAAYRGDKLTKRVWEAIENGTYIAQEYVPPSTRNVVVDGVRQRLKVDVRAYVYAGKVQMLAARLYQGQTTNMRTPGGGFSPVLSVPHVPEACCTQRE